ncbi:zinc-binding dehydrogenase [Schumannella sp. 10F1B-5-1]|uniref:zinc-dependent alcohol dehydrogenase n=1 Tax=Schumannella sp. 10F1B-5-1 TaxID=2590780 RepID=UPI0011306269|nr:zinc-binding dehydrogenase [Schumannella sp. 10F1B-5-1]TPW72931.1 zinc-binding dehydrogenase [Schumannella sp. 10F1B-5-1]
MKALQFTAQDTAEMVDLPVPDIADDEVLVALRAVGVCHSDIELLEGRYIIPFSYPIIPGHEWAGEVVRVGAKVTDFAPGDRVVGECVIGLDHFGFSISGAGAEFFVTKSAWLHEVPANVSWTNAALVEPFSVAYGALRKAGNVDASDVVVVLGAGPIGLMIAAASAALGATTIVVEPSESRRDAAIALGAHSAVAPEDIVAKLAELSGGRGADVVLEASGRPEVMAQALELAAFQGRVIYVGIDVGRDAPAKLGLIQSKELFITGLIGAPGAWPATLRFLSTTGLDLSSLVTGRFDLADSLKAIEAAHDRTVTIKAHIESSATL